MYIDYLYSRNTDRFVHQWRDCMIDYFPGFAANSDPDKVFSSHTNFTTTNTTTTKEQQTTEGLKTQRASYTSLLASAESIRSAGCHRRR